MAELEVTTQLPLSVCQWIVSLGPGFRTLAPLQNYFIILVRKGQFFKSCWLS